MFVLVKQKTADERRISDVSSDVCSSDLLASRTPNATFSKSQKSAMLILSWLAVIGVSVMQQADDTPENHAGPSKAASRPDKLGEPLSATRRSSPRSPHARHAAYRRTHRPAGRAHHRSRTRRLTQHAAIPQPTIRPRPTPGRPISIT